MEFARAESQFGFQNRGIESESPGSNLCPKIHLVEEKFENAELALAASHFGQCLQFLAIWGWQKLNNFQVIFCFMIESHKKKNANPSNLF